MEFCLITSCTHTRTALPVIEVKDMPSGLKMSEALDWWLKGLKSTPPSITPGELYRGLGFSTLTKIVEEFKPSKVNIVTGGQGLIDIGEKIVPYDFTADKKEQYNIHQKVTSEPFVQTVWWKMINEATGRTPTPIKTLVEGFQGDLILISCSKVFLRYISDDVLSINPDYWNRIRILLSASSVGSVPAQLRPFIVPFDRSAISHLPGNRNDNNHRAAWKFMDLIREEEGFASLPNTKQADYMSVDSPQGNIQLEQIFKDHPDLLKMTVEEAYSKVKRMYGTVGGRIVFRSVHRAFSGVKITTDSADVDQALSVLTSMDLAKGGGDANEDEDLTTLQVFVDACKKLPYNPTFTSVDVCNWAAKYFEKKNKQPSETFTSPNKLSFLLKNNTTLLGLIENSSGSGKSYSLNEVT